MKSIAIFASGSGSNAENIIRYFQERPERGEVALVVCNKADAGVLERAERLGVESRVMSRAEINDPGLMLPLLESRGVDTIVLAGFLLMVPGFLLERYNERILNIHPSLLPKFGGKGMYGRHVHEAVVAAGERETGITVHIVSEKCDEGRIVFQASVAVDPPTVRPTSRPRSTTLSVSTSRGWSTSILTDVCGADWRWDECL